jgi:hypothetical protein
VGNVSGLTLGSLSASVSVNGVSSGSAVQVATVVPPLNAPELAVRALYMAALGRPGSQQELDGWVALLPPGATSLTQAVTMGIEGSFEARDRLVKGWYVTYLGQQAGPGEETGFVSELLAGVTEEVVLSQILGSPEYFSHATSLIGGIAGNTNFIQSLYQLLLGRMGSAGEVAGWVSASQSDALTQQQVASLFLGSSEYRSDVVAGYYQSLLHRPAIAMEISAWVNSGLDEYTIRTLIEAAPEFFSSN